MVCGRVGMKGKPPALPERLFLPTSPIGACCRRFVAALLHHWPGPRLELTKAGSCLALPLLRFLWAPLCDLLFGLALSLSAPPPALPLSVVVVDWWP